MDYRALGRSGYKVSPICLGTMTFRGTSSEKEAARIIAAAQDAGINFIDTADQYGDGEAEEILGRQLKGRRDRWVLASKVGNPLDNEPKSGGLSRPWIMTACDDSLRRLSTERIDLYYFHIEDKETPLAESLEAIRDLLAAGKIGAFGLSNYRAWRVAEVVRLCDKLEMARPIASQPYYNAFNRMPEVEHMPACAHYGLGVVAYSPLARGVLTGKYPPTQKPPVNSRAGRQDKRILETEWREESLEKAQVIKAHAEAKGMTGVHRGPGQGLRCRGRSSCE
jgi:aryl-alcohol dehydrogenase (NADP+)